MSPPEERAVTRLFESARPATATHILRVDTGHPLVEAFVINGSLELVAHGQRTVEAQLPEGTYLVKFRAGDAVTEQWVNLAQDIAVTPHETPAPKSSTPWAEHDRWSDSETEAARSFVEPFSLAVIICDPERQSTPSDNVSIRSLSGDSYIQSLSNRSASAWQSLTSGPVSSLAGPAEPGPYLIRVTTPEIGTYEAATWVGPGFKTRVYLTRKYAAAWKVKRRTPHLGSAAVHMVRHDSTDEYHLRRLQLTEIICACLGQDRSLVPSEEIIEALHGKSDHVMLGLLAAHMLHSRIQYLTTKYSDRGEEAIRNKEAMQLTDLLRQAITNLDYLLPGCPDIGALGLRYGITLSGIDYGVPPMLAQSWSLIAPGAGRDLVPSDSYATRIAPAVTAVRPWLVWCTHQMLRPSQESTDQVKLKDVERLQKKVKRGKVVSYNPVAQMLAQTPLNQYESVEEIAESMGIPSSSLKAAVEQTVGYSKAGPTKKMTERKKKYATQGKVKQQTTGQESKQSGAGQYVDDAMITAKVKR